MKCLHIFGLFNLHARSFCVFKIQTEVDAETGEPLEKLTPTTVDWCRQIGSNATTVNDIIASKDPKIYMKIQQGIDDVNKSATSRAQYIQKWTILLRDFSMVGGELGTAFQL